ncbi:8546_t:CDS:2 [Rhizophagus irregularis]|nr:8546_t:CDS:2 [Rhizophagus irregularis]
MVNDLLRIVELNTFPLAIRNHQTCRLFIWGYPYLSANPEFFDQDNRHVHNCCGGHSQNKSRVKP